MKKRLLRVLAIDLNTRGFGFVVIEGSDHLIDWGLRDIREEKERNTLEKVDDLIRLYRPSVIVVEDIDDPSSRRGPRIEKTLRQVAELATQRRVSLRRVSTAKMRGVFARQGARNKHEIAGVIVARFPELGLYRPPKRRLWMSEDQRQAVFDAAAMVVGCPSPTECENPNHVWLGLGNSAGPGRTPKAPQSPHPGPHPRKGTRISLNH
ncbi:MAG: hypothetical protein AAB417_00460 [Patescibacteria group bacterium]